ncbi:MAG: YlmC/YmxH family sporulation protein [Ruminococcaceae bacterium]|nr:YlmC/YmxH family sporulation protein [Oscillospiraceae bacterium]
MRRVSTADLRRLEVINLCGGERLGYPCDFEIDLDCGSILSLIVSPEGRGFSLFGECEDYVIPWCRIECIGEDAILVKLDRNEISCCQSSKGRKKRK